MEEQLGVGTWGFWGNQVSSIIYYQSFYRLTLVL